MNIRYLPKLSVIICIAFCVLLFAYGRPVGLLLYTKWQIRNKPKLWNVPSPLLLETPAESSGRKFSYFGYEFYSPWTDLRRERKMESTVILNFSTGDSVTILAPSKNGGELDAVKREASTRGVDVRKVFGDESTRSNYALRSKVFSLTPRDLNLSPSRQEMAATSALLTMKEIETNLFRGGLFSFRTEWFRGFQVGEPALDDMVVVDAYDSQDHKLVLYIGAERNATSRPSQSEVNVILGTLRPASSPE